MGRSNVKEKTLKIAAKIFSNNVHATNPLYGLKYGPISLKNSLIVRQRINYFLPKSAGISPHLLVSHLISLFLI